MDKLWDVITGSTGRAVWAGIGGVLWELATGLRQPDPQWNVIASDMIYAFLWFGAGFRGTEIGYDGLRAVAGRFRRNDVPVAATTVPDTLPPQVVQGQPLHVDAPVDTRDYSAPPRTGGVTDYPGGSGGVVEGPAPRPLGFANPQGGYPEPPAEYDFTPRKPPPGARG